ncbi:MAG: DEAD/DEAH box helicase, partial [Campylobacterales bacterium]|nr:DEAD/DEAH box helicase [Campylobacterales bacterium]
ADVKDDMSKKLVKDIEEQKIYNQAAELVQILEEEMELSQITFKLMSMLMDGQKVHGPDKIGIDKRRLEKMLENFKKNSRDRNKNSKYRGGRGGNRSRNSRSRDSRNRRDGGSQRRR